MAIRVMLAVIVLSGAVLAARPAVPQGASGPAVTITGRVVDADADTPVEGVKVGSRQTGWVETTADGRYTLPGVPAGRAQIWVDPEFIAVSYAESKFVMVTGGRDISNLDFHVRLFGTISGRVTDERGAPVSGAAVVTIVSEFGGAPASGDQLPFANGDLFRVLKNRATTNARGEFVLSQVRAGLPHRILAYRPKFAVRPSEDPGSNPAARPRALAATYFPRAASFDAATAVTIRTHERRERVDITMTDGPSYCMDIRTIRVGMPQPAYVSVEEAEVFAQLSPGSADVQTTSGHTGPTSTIKVCDLPPGTYRVSAATMASDWYSGTIDAVVRDRDLADVIVSPAPPITVPGEIVWAVNRPDDRLGPNLTIASSPLRYGLRWQELAGPFTAMFQRDTFYSFGIGVGAPNYVSDITYNGSSILHRSFVAAANGGPLRILVGRDGAYLRTRVQLPDGQPAANRWVLVLSADAATEAELSGGIVAGLTDENGVCQFQGLRPATYRVLTMGIPPPAVIPLPSENAWIERTPETLRQLRRVRDTGTALTLAPNARVEIGVVSR